MSRFLKISLSFAALSFTAPSAYAAGSVKEWDEALRNSRALDLKGLHCTIRHAKPITRDQIPQNLQRFLQDNGTYFKKQLGQDTVYVGLPAVNKGKVPYLYGKMAPRLFVGRHANFNGQRGLSVILDHEYGLIRIVSSTRDLTGLGFGSFNPPRPEMLNKDAIQAAKNAARKAEKEARTARLTQIRDGMTPLLKGNSFQTSQLNQFKNLFEEAIAANQNSTWTSLFSRLTGQVHDLNKARIHTDAWRAAGIALIDTLREAATLVDAHVRGVKPPSAEEQKKHALLIQINEGMKTLLKGDISDVATLDGMVALFRRAAEASPIPAWRALNAHIKAIVDNINTFGERNHDQGLYAAVGALKDAVIEAAALVNAHIQGTTPPLFREQVPETRARLTKIAEELPSLSNPTVATDLLNPCYKLIVEFYNLSKVPSLLPLVMDIEGSMHRINRLDLQPKQLMLIVGDLVERMQQADALIQTYVKDLKKNATPSAATAPAPKPAAQPKPQAAPARPAPKPVAARAPAAQPKPAAPKPTAEKPTASQPSEDQGSVGRSAAPKPAKTKPVAAKPSASKRLAEIKASVAKYATADLSRSSRRERLKSRFDEARGLLKPTSRTLAKLDKLYAERRLVSKRDDRVRKDLKSAEAAKKSAEVTALKKEKAELAKKREKFYRDAIKVLAQK